MNTRPTSRIRNPLCSRNPCVQEIKTELVFGFIPLRKSTDRNLNFICCNTVILLHLVPVYTLRAVGSAGGSGNSIYPFNRGLEKIAAYTAGFGAEELHCQQARCCDFTATLGVAFVPEVTCTSVSSVGHRIRFRLDSTRCKKLCLLCDLVAARQLRFAALLDPFLRHHEWSCGIQRQPQGVQQSKKASASC